MKSTTATAGAKSKPEEGEKKYPLFLNKTFAMLKTSRTDIATWAEDGLSFYIIDQARFVDSVIPQYFKHSNFSSFVRQLNFYGFRKVWSDQLIEMVICCVYYIFTCVKRLSHLPLFLLPLFYYYCLFQQQNGFEKVLEFKHPFFQRDNPDLLGQIRKIVNGSDVSRTASEINEIATLKSDVEELKVHLYMLSNKLVMLSNSVSQLLDQNASDLPSNPNTRSNSTEDDEPSPKKRKTASSSSSEDAGLVEIGNTHAASSSSSSSLEDKV